MPLLYLSKQRYLKVLLAEPRAESKPGALTKLIR